MKRISEYIKRSVDEFSGREDIEWANFWYDYANDSEKKRILLVGDSTARMVRSTFSQKYGIAVDLLGTSAGLHDVLLKSQIEAFFASNKYLYEAIFVQVGHHGIITDSGEEIRKEEDFVFEEDYKGLVDYLSQYTSRIILLSIFESVLVPDRQIKNVWLGEIMRKITRIIMPFKKNRYDFSANEITIRRNKIIERIAEEYKVVYVDINQIMKKAGYRHIDHIHFVKSANKFICKNYAEFIEDIIVK